MGEENCFKIKTRKMGGNMRKLRHILNRQMSQSDNAIAME